MFQLQPLSLKHLKQRFSFSHKDLERNYFSKGVTDIYTGKDFTKENYEIYGGLSIDHFIPWSFVLHDEMWNLVPTFKNINSSKSDKLLNYNRYIDDFCDMQYMAVTYILEKESKKIQKAIQML